MKDKVIAAYDRTQWFTDREAWTLFRLTAFGEAIGWTMLITGVLFAHYGWPGYASVLLLMGRVHGMLFIIYIAAALLLSRSLALTKTQTVVAGLMSVPPYGTLVFEQWLARRRKGAVRGAERQVTVRAVIKQGRKLLAVQPKDRPFWCLPGGTVAAHETPQQALARLVYELTGQRPVIGELVYMQNYQHGAKERLELFFAVSNATDYRSIMLENTIRGKIELDEIRFIDPRHKDLRPESTNF